jgi:hypothetical protein
MAMDQHGEAVVFDGKSWGAATSFDPNSETGDIPMTVSCPSVGHCTTVDGTFNAFFLNGRDWCRSPA